MAKRCGRARELEELVREKRSWSMRIRREL
ncbi:hypothetical protein A2U01_0091188, partial [Trifolium medium]|nr:hypothetical protein [Trifolium medium]